MAKTLKWIVIIAIIALVGFFAYSNSGLKFDSMYKSVKSSFDSKGMEMLALGSSKEKTAALHAELSSMRKNLNLEFLPSSDNEAMKLYLDSKLNMLQGALLLYELDNFGNKIQYSPPDCSEKGDIAIAKNQLSDSTNNLEDSLANAKNFKSKYPSYAAKTELADISNYEGLVNSIKANAPLLEERLNAFCG